MSRENVKHSAVWYNATWRCGHARWRTFVITIQWNICPSASRIEQRGIHMHPSADLFTESRCISMRSRVTENLQNNKTQLKKKIPRSIQRSDSTPLQPIDWNSKSEKRHKLPVNILLTNSTVHLLLRLIVIICLSVCTTSTLQSTTYYYYLPPTVD